MDRPFFNKKQNAQSKISPVLTNSATSNNSGIRASVDREYRIDVQTISIDTITDTITSVVEHIHNDFIARQNVLSEKLENISILSQIIRGKTESLEQLVDVLISQLSHLEKWDQLEPIYMFHAHDTACDRVDEYTITFCKTPLLTMLIDAHHASSADDIEPIHITHRFELKRQSPAFK